MNNYYESTNRLLSRGHLTRWIPAARNASAFVTATRPIASNL